MPSTTSARPTTWRSAPPTGSVPQPRVLITGHAAFNYFGQTYDLEVRATYFVSTDAALSPTELSELADLIAEEKVPVIFQDNQANPQAITSLQEAVESRGWQVEISERELYADSLCSEPGLDTYLGVFLHNAEAVAEALGGGEDLRSEEHTSELQSRGQLVC